MLYTRRDVGKIALATGFASRFSPKLMAAAKPNSKINGVQIGTITYSFRSMPDQSGEAMLQYIVDSGISAIELEEGLSAYVRKAGKWDSSPAAAAAAAAAAGTGGRGGGAGRGGGRGPAPTYPLVAGMTTGLGNNQPAGQWNGKTCPAPAARGGAAAGAPGAPAAAGAAAGAARGGGGGGRGGEQTPEQKAAADAERKWRLALPMSIFTDLRKMYNDAGVTIYAVKDVRQDTDDDLDYTFKVAQALGATHVTSELPTGDTPEIVARLKKLGDWAMKYKMVAAYHSHGQGSMTAFDACFAASPGNRSNVDLGHFTASNGPELALQFLNKFHDKISSFHMKDRTGPTHCSLNLPWGEGETPLKEILQTVQKNKWTMPASIEQEYAIPEGSDAVKEVAKCLEFCRRALA